MQLALATWPEVERYLGHRRSIIVPIGSTEQHGPTGLLGTDAICATAIAEEVGKRVGAYVAPTINVGMAQHHLGFPGTVSLRPTTLIAVIVDCVMSLRRGGFTKFLFINAHGGNVSSIRTAFSELYAQASFGGTSPDDPIACDLHNWWETQGVVALAAALYGEGEGAHATASEISLAMHAQAGHRPEHQRVVGAAAPLAPFTDAFDFRRRYPDGRIGSDPSLSRTEHGGAFLDAAATDLARVFVEFERGT